MFHTAAIRILKPSQLDQILRRREGHLEGVDEEVRTIIEAVAKDGDIAIINYTERLDGVTLTEEQLIIKPEAMQAALERIEPETRAVLERAARQIEETQKALLAPPVFIAGDGVTLEARQVPVVRAGIYVPGGRGVYPLLLLAGVIAAKVAGVEDVTVASPPQKNGSLPDVILAAAAIARADRMLVAAGVPAVAALAYGTDSVARVEKLAGPGNRFVSVAKKLLYGRLDLDLLAGPSEIVILADDSADPDAVALDLCGQAEQDPACLPLLITPSEELAKKVREKLAELLRSQSRRELIQAALMGGGIMMVESLDEGVRLAERVAPELLLLAVRDPDDLLPHIRRAGLVMLGHATPPGLALSQSGLCPILPTTSTARHASGLSANFFRRTLNVVRYNEAALKREGPDAVRIALIEGHLAQAEAIRVRMK